MNKPQKQPRVSLTSQIISFFESEIAAGRVGYKNGFDIHILAIMFTGVDTSASRARVKNHLADAKWYFQGKDFILGSVLLRGQGYRYCIVNEQWEAMSVQGLHTRHAAGNLKRMMTNEPVLQGQNLLPTPLDKRLMSLGPFVDLWRALPRRTN